MSKKTNNSIIKNKETDILKTYSAYMSSLFLALDSKALKEVGDLIIRQSRKGKKAYVIGNGGSASTASHFAVDFTHCSLLDHRPIISAISLSDNSALLTAVSNDVGYEKIFSKPLEHLGTKGDIVIAISASGNSQNLIEAFKVAKKIGMYTVALVGFDGGKLLKMADKVIHVKTARGEYGPVEDVHLSIGHMLASYISEII